LEKGGLDREHAADRPRHNDIGIDKAAQELFTKVRAEHANDMESGMHTQAGIPLPFRARDEKHKAELIEKLIDSANGDPFDEINMLSSCKQLQTENKHK
jgi:hypothetical protein